MTRQEYIDSQQRRATVLLEFYELKELPKGPLQVAPHMKIINVKTFVTGQIVILNNYWADPFNRQFVNSLNRLLSFKNYLENGNQRQPEP